MINKKISLRTQMLLTYVGIVIICMLVIPVSISRLLDWQFKHFVENKLSEDRQEATLFLEAIYNRCGFWNDEVISKIHGGFLHWPIIEATVYDKNGAHIRTFSKQSRHHGGRMRAPLNRNRSNLNASKLLTFSNKLTSQGREIGSVSFTVISFKNGPEEAFLKRFNKILYISVAFMIIISIFIAFLMAEKISRPILSIAKRALNISKGSYNLDSKIKTNITEIQVLIESIRKLGLDLQEQELLRIRLMSDIAHELRSPVAIIKSHLEAFADGVWEATEERLDLTVEEIDRLSALISEVETLSALEERDDNLELSLTNLSDELEKSLLLYDPLFQNKSVTLLREIEPNIVAVVDIQKINQAVGNLLSNALRYTDEENTVTLSLKNIGNVIELSVKDSGIGISAQDLPNIFERFYRTDESRSRASGGMGIGLAIAKAIIEGHGGTLSVESTEGVGSKFTIKIPLAINKELF